MVKAMNFYCETITNAIIENTKNQSIIDILSSWQHALSQISNPELPAPDLQFLFRKFILQYSENLMILTPVLLGSDFMFIHYGDYFHRELNEDYLGRTMRDIPGMQGRVMSEAYQNVVSARQPALIISTAHMASSVHIWERLAIPVRIPDGTVGLIVYAAPRRLKRELIKMIFETNSNGILVIEAVFDDLGTIIDGRITAVNSAACQITGRSLEQLEHHRLLSVFPGLIENGMWDLYRKVMDEQSLIRFDISLIDKTMSGLYRITAAPIEQGLTVTMVDVSDLGGDTIPVFHSKVGNISEG